MNIEMSDLLRTTGDHLWQSTVFAGGILILTLAFRRTRASVRYWLWLVASIKFAIPFAALIALGTSLQWTHAPLPQPTLRLAIDAAAQPFSPARSVMVPTAHVETRVVTEPWLDPSLRSAAMFAATRLWALGAALVLCRWIVRWIQMRRLLSGGTQLHEGREVEILRRIERDCFAGTCGAGGGPEDPPRRVPDGPPVRVPQGTRLRIVAVDSTIEPGVAGLLSPVLMWPATISARLDDEQIAAIFAHELAHVRRRDNVTAAMHMLVETIFWFHPLVWWLGARLVDERERACDEDVLRSGTEPQRYAEGILKTCEFYLEAPLPCVTGVTGADLKKRIEAIMRNRPANALGHARTFLLSVCALAAIATPITVGVMRAPRLLAQSSTVPESGVRFDAVSVKHNTSGVQGGIARVQGDHYSATNVTLRQLILNAYGVLQSQLVGGSPLLTSDFLAAEHFDIEATLPAGAGQPQFPEMLRAMLADRFKLVAHMETREMPVYALVKARADGRLGPQLRPADDKACVTNGPGAGPRAGGPPPLPPPAPNGPVGPAVGGPPLVGVVGGRQQGPQGCGSLQFGPGTFTAKSVRLDILVNSLSNRTPITGIDRVILDRTGLADTYDFELRWRMPAPAAGPLPAGAAAPEPDPDRPDLFTALQEQLGLRLEPQRAPIQVLVVDSVQMPSGN